MQVEELWRDETSLLKYLAGELQAGRLTVFLGAGASGWYGLPGWPELLERMYEDVGMTPGAGLSLPAQAQQLLDGPCAGRTDEFLGLTKQALYRDVEVGFSRLRADNLLASIGALVMASQRGHVSQVVTLNWDDLLERYLGFHGVVVESVCEARHWYRQADVTVFHPHGYLPSLPGKRDSSSIVFTEDTYAERVGAPAADWNKTVTSMLVHRTCLFVGLSGRDDALATVLNDVAKNHVAVIDDGFPFWGVVFSTEDEKRRELWEKSGVCYHAVKNYDPALPELLFKICQLAANGT